MAWHRFPHPDAAWVHTPDSLRAAWPRLHGGDREAFPDNPALVLAWIAFHAGEYERAARLGLDAGVGGYAVAHKATCMYARYLETSVRKRIATYECVAERCERQQAEQPDNAAGFYWHAFALGHYSQGISVVKALAQGVGATVRHSLETAARLAPSRADVHVAIGVYHAEIIDKVGAMIGGLSYGAKKEEGYRHFQRALELDPGSAIARVQYARAMLKLDGKKKTAEIWALYEQAAASAAHDATEWLDVAAAQQELNRERQR